VLGRFEITLCQPSARHQAHLVRGLNEPSLRLPEAVGIKPLQHDRQPLVCGELREETARGPLVKGAVQFSRETHVGVGSDRARLTVQHGYDPARAKRRPSVRRRLICGGWSCDVPCSHRCGVAAEGFIAVGRGSCGHALSLTRRQNLNQRRWADRNDGYEGCYETSQ